MNCDNNCGSCRYQLDPTHCADVVSGAASEVDGLRAENERLRRELDLERGQKRADLLQDLAEVTVALRNLIASVEAAKTRDAIVLRDLEAARAVLENT